MNKDFYWIVDIKQNTRRRGIYESHKKIYRGTPLGAGIALLFILLSVCAFFGGIKTLDLDDKIYHETHITYSVLAIAASFIIIILAYFKSKESIKLSRLNYLLQIDERWSNTENIKAREIIHKMFLDVKKSHPKYNHHQIAPLIAVQIRDLHDNPNKIEDYIILANFVDFLETIGYLYEQTNLTTVEIKEFLGNSLIYFYEIFSIYISYKRQIKDQSLYDKFEKLYIEMKKNQQDHAEKN